MAVTPSEYKRQFLASEDAVTAREQLESMLKDPKYHTASFYTPTLDENMSFVDKHLMYLSEHPKLNFVEYLSNLRLKTKFRG
ncbi:MAG: hypothetical protein ABIR37_04490 [Candidatus Saccharimonadales bacterium]